MLDSLERVVKCGDSVVEFAEHLKKYLTLDSLDRDAAIKKFSEEYELDLAGKFWEIDIGEDEILPYQDFILNEYFQFIDSARKEMIKVKQKLRGLLKEIKSVS